MFGFRSGAGSGWMMLLGELEKEPGFRKSLLLKNRYANIEEMINSGKNIWAPIIDKLNLLGFKPFAIGSKPDKEMIAKSVAEKEARIAQHIADYKKKYGVDTDQEAISAYKADFDNKTAELDAIAANQTLPGFVENPPFTLDGQLQYDNIELDNGVPMFAATFNNMTSSTLYLYLKMNVVPKNQLVYLPFLPTLLTGSGVIEEGVPVKYDEMTDRLRKELLNLNMHYDAGNETKRIELVLSGQAGNYDELQNVLHWFDLVLYSPYLSSDNLPRINDLIDQMLSGFRNRTKSPEEYWVNDPATAYRYQDNPLFLATSSFMTEQHFMQRLKWQFVSIDNDDIRKDLNRILDSLQAIDNPNRDELNTILTNIASEGEAEIDQDEHVFSFVSFGNQCRSLACELANELKQTLSDIPDANLSSDWKYLCGQFKKDLNTTPDQAIGNINSILDNIRKSELARMVMISNGDDRSNSLPMINNFVSKLSDEKPTFVDYGTDDVIIDNLKSRASVDSPVYVGLKHDGTRNGVMIFNARVADKYDTTEESVLDCLAGKLYSGGGPHGFFMNTWAAGLAYSNGYGYGQSSGRCSYYAERCPDVAETMRFVVNLIKDAEDKPELVDYAIAQVFASSRAQSRYEARGVQMATDFVDGNSPDKVKAFRQKVFELKDDPNLYDKLQARMEAAYGPVLIGYGEPLANSDDGVFFLIGPDSQFESLEKYIESTEGNQTIFKLYPRYYWLKI